MFAEDDIRSSAPQLAAYDYSQCTHPYTRSAGHTTCGSRRVECRTCGKRWTIELTLRRQAFISRIAAAFREGCSAQECQRRGICGVKAAYLHFRQFRALGMRPKCACGKDSSHHGPCAARAHFFRRGWAQAAEKLRARRGEHR